MLRRRTSPVRPSRKVRGLEHRALAVGRGDGVLRVPVRAGVGPDANRQHARPVLGHGPLGSGFRLATRMRRHPTRIAGRSGNPTAGVRLAGGRRRLIEPVVPGELPLDRDKWAFDSDLGQFQAERGDVSVVASGG